MSYACSQVPGSNHTHHCLGRFWLVCHCGTFHSKCCNTWHPFSNRHCTWYHPNKDRIYLGPLHSPWKEVGKLLKYYIIIVLREGSVLKQETINIDSEFFIYITTCNNMFWSYEIFLQALEASGHTWTLHSWDAVSESAWFPFTVQLSPTALGSGLSQVRFLVCSPPPHVSVQLDQALQSPHIPWTDI